VLASGAGVERHHLNREAEVSNVIRSFPGYNLDKVVRVLSGNNKAPAAASYQDPLETIGFYNLWKHLAGDKPVVKLFQFFDSIHGILLL